MSRPVRRRAAAGMFAAYLVGSLPCSWLVAYATRGVDLREVGIGTVSGTGVYRVAGLPALVVAGALDVAKGAAAVAVARRVAGGPAGHLPGAAAAAVTGHNWSPFLAGAGGRGIGPAIGALLPTAPAGSALLLAGVCGGKAAGHTALGSLLAYLALPPVLGLRHGRRAAHTGVGVALALLAKRLVGNARPDVPAAYMWRLLYDRDTRTPLP